MNLTDKFDYIESVTFACYVNVASGFSVVKMGLRMNEVVTELIEALEESPKFIEEVVTRFEIVLKDLEKPEYMHPHDPAITAYLYALSKTDHIQAYLAAKKAQQVPQLWWAKRLANEIIENQETAGFSPMKG